MIKSITTTFDFGKLATKLMDEVLGTYVDRSKSIIAENAKSNIKDGKLRNLRKSTIAISDKGISGKRRNIMRTSNNALYHSGSLLRSIKNVKDGIEVNGYVKYHMDGFNIAGNSWTRKFAPKAIGRKVNPRNPFFTKGGNYPKAVADDIKKSKKLLKKEISKALKSRKTVKFK